jgi:hypothetical protein
VEKDIIDGMVVCGRNHYYDSDRGPCSECRYLVHVARSLGFYLIQVPWEWSLSASRIRCAALLARHLGPSPDDWADLRGFEKWEDEFRAILASHALPPIGERYCTVEIFGDSRDEKTREYFLPTTFPQPTCDI